MDARQNKNPFWGAMGAGLKLDLISPSEGWIVWNGQLLATTNRAGNWTQINPEPNQTGTASGTTTWPSSPPHGLPPQSRRE